MNPSMTEFGERRRWFQEALDGAELDGALISSPVNVRYLTGFTGSNSLLLMSSAGAELFTDPRYTVQIEQEADAEKKTVATGTLLKAVCTSVRRRRMRTVGFEGLHLTYDSYARLSAALGEKINLKSLGRELEERRAVKSESEVGAIRQAVKINSEAYEKALKRFKAGMLESELALELDYQMRRMGAECPAFDTIVASGAHAALPHAHPRAVPIETNALLLVDMGAQANGYASDMTRMALPGKPSRRAVKLYRAVLEAQQEAIRATRPGATAASVDQAARRVLKSAGLDSLFIHSTGHGLGLEIHEHPRIGKTEKSALQAGMVITIEPGVYVEGWGGIRIEDTVLVTAGGCEVLTPTGKELRVL
ncbi:MAG TPA: Xaa-Pro peptidase family protein [Bryobacteraceae bacterium]|nr:Xaa-Pro peptidase family protein [Bryobacteraceae bacterium]